MPDSLSDEEAVIAEPFACAIHAALKAPMEESATILVLGCGSIGVLTICAYRAAGGKGKIVAVARYPHQEEAAQKFGANLTIQSATGLKLYLRFLQDMYSPGGDISSEEYPPTILKPEIGKPVPLGGGVDCVIDCVGSSDSIDDAMRLTRPRGTLVLAGMPGIPEGIDWTSVWYKELRVQGAYAYGWEQFGEQRVKTMQLALDYLQKSNGALKPLVNRKFPLSEYRAALDSAFHAGRSGAFKTVFEVK